MFIHNASGLNMHHTTRSANKQKKKKKSPSNEQTLFSKQLQEHMTNTLHCGTKNDTQTSSYQNKQEQKVEKKKKGCTWQQAAFSMPLSTTWGSAVMTCHV